MRMNLQRRKGDAGEGRALLKQLLKEFLLLFASKMAEMQHPISVGRNGYIEALRCIRVTKITEAKMDFIRNGLWTTLEPDEKKSYP